MHLCSCVLWPQLQVGTASRTCLDCYKEHDMHHSKPIEHIESRTAKRILCQRKSKALTTIFGGKLSKAAPQLVGGNPQAICSSCQGNRLWDICCIPLVGEENKQHLYIFQCLTTQKLLGNGHHHPSAACSYQVSQIWTMRAFFPLHCTSALSVAFRKCGSLEVATHKLRVCTGRRHLEHTKLKIISRYTIT